LTPEESFDREMSFVKKLKRTSLDDLSKRTIATPPAFSIAEWPPLMLPPDEQSLPALKS
jgi:hypothetical protein